jgi:DNA processing protein
MLLYCKERFILAKKPSIVNPMNLLDEKIYANALNIIPQLGPVSLAKLLNYFGSFTQAWQGKSSEYAKAGLPPKSVSEIIARKPKINPEQVFAELTRRSIETVLLSEKAYPAILKEISTAPPLLYVRGRQEVLNTATIAVVGTRKMTNYGRAVCEELVMGLVTNGITVVSGLAFGIDAVGLNCAVENSGKSVAVLASDLDNSSISPRSNFALAQKIMEAGCLVSEYPLGNSVQKQNFPIRNRIISGLSLGTLVVEADAESGALITANFALEQNREVFAIPGSIFSPVSRGTNELIKKGAKLVVSAFDILDELNLTASSVDLPVELETSEIEGQILSSLTRDPIHIDDLIKTVKLSPGVVNANLTLLEMKGRIKNLGGAKYVKVR